MLADTGHKGFDRACSIVTTGNVYSHTQHSGFVRPECRTECNGFTFSRGHLQERDLQVFVKFRLITDHVYRRVVRRSNETGESVILYAFFYCPTRGRRVMMGNIITAKDHSDPECYPWPGSPKGRQVLEKLVTYVSV